jgi:hypothetical protein
MTRPGELHVSRAWHSVADLLLIFGRVSRVVQTAQQKQLRLQCGEPISHVDGVGGFQIMVVELQGVPLVLEPVVVASRAGGAGVLRAAVPSTGPLCGPCSPLGIAVVGSLLLSQLLTVYTTPVIYLYLERVRMAVGRVRAALGLRSATHGGG